MAARPQPLRPEPEKEAPPSRSVVVSPGGAGRKVQRLIILALVLIGGWFALQEAHQRVLFVKELDARVVADLVTVSSRVAGRLIEVSVRAGDPITRGQVLARVDARESELMVEELEARAKGLASERNRMMAERDLIDMQTRTRLETQLSTANAAQATANALDPQLELALSELARAESLFEKRVIAMQQVEQTRATARRIEGEHRAAKAEYEESVARLAEARADRARLKVIDEELDMLSHRRDELVARLALQQIDLEDRVIRAPADGVVDITFVEAGEYVRPGQRIAIVHDPDRVWVESNIKETQISRLKEGQPVRIVVDAYPDARYTGRLESIGSSTTASYALLPNPNPSGNFTKVTQRLPVRIALENADRRLHPGMMVEVQIDVGGN
jgi:membrane fusion protein (multidrug efflux system)